MDASSSDGPYFTEDELLPLSGLQHLVFCERQWGLIHIEQQWQENRLTAEGRLMHEKVDEGPDETRRGIRIVRSLALRSLRLGLTGKADVVEFPLSGASPLPVEYKRGKPKVDGSDEVQLCAQGLCLEEMLGVAVAGGALYYGTPRRRMEVNFDDGLRAKTVKLAARMQSLFRERVTPAAKYEKKCRSCSLIEICQPKMAEKVGSVDRYWKRVVKGNLETEER